MKTNRPQLTISLLASDRPDTLRRCLDSLRPIMEAIPCELILIDTSKNSVVHDMLLEYSDQVYEFEWCQDFAKARNEGMRRAKGEWFLYLDDDEWFVEIDAIVEFFRSGEYKQYGYANYQIRNFLDVNYTHYNDGWVSRMVQMNEDIHFISKIHEYFTPVRGPRKDLYAMAYHSGYVYETVEKRRAHFERNSVLLLDMIKEEPDNIRWRLQLAQEYSSVGEWEKLIECCEQCLELTANENSDFMNISIGTFYTGLATGLLRQQKYEKSVQSCKRALADKRSRKILRAMMHLKLGENYLHLGKWHQAIEHTTEYLHMVQTIDQKKSAIIEEKCALLVGTALDDSNQIIAHGILICCQLEMGNIKALLECYDKLGWNQEVIYCLEDMEKYMVKAMWTLPYDSIFIQVVADAFKNKRLRELFCEEILAQDMQHMNVFQEVLAMLAESLGYIVNGPQQNDMIGYHNSLQKYVQAVCLWYDFLQEQEALELLGEELPGYIQVAEKIGDYIQLESQDEVRALGKLKEAVDVFPELAKGMGEFLHSYGELEKQRAELRRNEMETLRIQVIGQVKAMIADGQTQAASQIIAQLKQMFPGDLEITELENCI